MKRLVFPLFLISIVFFLASCSSQGKIEFSDPEPSGPSNTNITTTEKENPDSQQSTSSSGSNASIIIQDSNQASSLTPVESTVNAVYDSVVSIDVKSTSFSGSGSGVLFSYDSALGLSFIVTCFHVIEDCANITVTLTNGNTYPATLVGGYSDEDIAVISIEETGLTYASFYEDSEKLRLGSQVVCIGNPLGTLPGSVSSGYLSYKNREVKIDSSRTMKLLQTDVAINSGNSGGGLFNTSGALIGIVNAKYADEAIEGLGFAIPVNTVRDIIEDFEATAKYDTASKTWQPGYVLGDWELGFTISGQYFTGGWMGTISYAIYVSELDTNVTASGNTVLKKDDIITAVKIDYNDESKVDIESLSISSASSLLTEIYSADLSLEDSLIFTINRNNTILSVEVELIQFIYSI